MPFNLNIDPKSIAKFITESEREFQERLELTNELLEERFPSLTNHPLFSQVVVSQISLREGRKYPYV